MRRIDVRLSISREEFLRWYSGASGTVRAVAVDGSTVSFPANILQPFVTHEGVTGHFTIYFEDSGKFKEIRKNP